MAGSLDVLRQHGDTAWAAGQPGALTGAVEAELEQGHVLVFPQLVFGLTADEQRFLDPAWADGKAKNITLRAGTGELRGAAGARQDVQALQAMIERFRDQANALVDRLFPHYRGFLRPGHTTYRPVQVAGRVTSWRKDDTRLHVDAFPSNPTRGVRLLRVFHNLNPHGEPRAWRVGEPFEAFARRFLPTTRRPLPGSAWLLHRLGVTKAQRSEYDHLMLQLHDHVKADMGYQRSASQRAINFAPGTTWLVFSDQVLHAAMSGQYMLEQTLYLDVEHQLQPHTSPLRTLERLTGRPLLS
ncbi:Kdo hydroxylase family protein [Ideonella sp. BN130291]|uniref:Kdo hydroxylase family protein n=1 Tax=Ideonella sp. BN130291 TaxID=3112940 RepID=UPI002E25CC1D|nr:Kdo hydroxylase family protein [Ideonella sp. BN130291]